MSMTWEEIRKEAYQLSVSDRLLLVEAIVRSLSNELRPRPEPTEGIVERLAGSLKTDTPPPTDKEIDAILENRLKGKYL
ncbi:hypothetical protein Glo7428_4126 [Gloeocapsa sp. PCC 7428]|uniref:hypothetical protein n=1 Tax=Gloeocapsa sp. PCC 7428 TaxID=1173026 RepID=UPI0002A5BC3E|nr:hypothetical protein [Gloeocapsa sp. PCC 7428]AFZ32575.1 hypothetical protein Glo7428_4126 [Gloeocapsa sp. PCC 7428]